jgi:hypothetical protein
MQNGKVLFTKSVTTNAAAKGRALATGPRLNQNPITYAIRSYIPETNRRNAAVHGEGCDRTTSGRYLCVPAVIA